VESLLKKEILYTINICRDIGITFGIRIGTPPIGWRNENPGIGDNNKL
jgi:hypothetical protein